MPENKQTDLHVKGGSEKKDASPPNWRSTLLGVGMFTIIVALFVGAASKDAAGLAPKIIGAIGLSMMVVAILANIAKSVLAKMNAGREASVERRS